MGRHSPAVLLARRMLINRETGNPSRPQPVAVLLGPVGSGKTTALEAIRRDLGWGVVHAGFDFGHGDRASTIDVLTKLAYSLSSKWRNRPKPQFVRFTIALIAVQAELSGRNRDEDLSQLKALINSFHGIRWTPSMDTLLDTLTETAKATGLVEPSYAAVFRQTFPHLVRNIRPRLGKALRSLADFPNAEGRTPFDALLELNRLAHGSARDAKAVTEWLMAAFLGDVRENHPRLAKPEEKSPCACDISPRRRHWHNWVIALDDVDHAGGTEFLADLIAARERFAVQHPNDREAHDALLIIATSGRWHDAWGTAWLAPWKPAAGAPRTVRPVADCEEASYDDWANPRPGVLESPYYPVRLAPQPIGLIARVLDSGARTPKVGLAHRATGGLPSAVEQLAAQLRASDVREGDRDVLTTDPRGEQDPCYRRLTELGLTEHLDDVHIDDFVTAAPFATAPWLIPDAAQSRIDQPHVGRILTELRTALWVTAKNSAGTTDDQAALHPWIAANLVSALARRGDGAGPSYTGQFKALRDDPDTAQDPVRLAYCNLALGDISEVVTFFEREFNRIPHAEWVAKLELVLNAPDDLPPERPHAELYDELVNLDAEGHPTDRSEIRNNVARLIAAGRLAANPFAVPGQNQHQVIANAFAALATTSHRPDVGALVSAKDLARRGEFP
ncbi:hypothetical protein AVL48_18085 [Amycolatopsis regifaucium]|uniref:Uncharacterized protein n=1 Tax=Amycolatopsis regifaucium TaxID=546365 RepID=A0A154M4C7_9PSEU|nr:hypothetical protein AVL48_18085 [Amycolatopsis regifaucium]OKA07665.1 hypothetical protein ATP06_0217770 [Amycolatopsis regifaucium]SFH05929.1 hypothetical protein SAMN04489731_102258 [Amycolatopsis regifaucium]